MLLLKTTLTTENIFLLCFKYLLLPLYCSIASWSEITGMSRGLEITYLQSPLFMWTQEDLGKVRDPSSDLCRPIPSL